jgi:hypothetical protein
MGVPVVFYHVVNQPHTSSPHFASFPYGLPAHCFMVMFFLPAPPQDHEPTISSTISLPICEPLFISPTSYRNSPMRPPPFISCSRNLCPTWGTHFTLGHSFLYLYISTPQLFIICCTNAFYFFLSLLFVVTGGDLLSFWPHATHVTLGWSITSHFPLSASSISSEYYPGHLPLSSEFVHLVSPLAQLIPDLVIPMTLDLVKTVVAIPSIIYPPTKGSLESSHFLTSSMYLCHFFTTVDSTEPLASGSRVLLLSTSTHFSKRATVS